MVIKKSFMRRFYITEPMLKLFRIAILVTLISITIDLDNLFAQNNQIQNPNYTPILGCNYSSSDFLYGDCFPGWYPASFTPTLGESDRSVFLWGNPASASEAIRGTFVSGLIPGNVYTLSVEVRAEKANINYDTKVDNFYIELSRSTLYRKVGGTIASSASERNARLLGRDTIIFNESDFETMGNKFSIESTNSENWPGALHPDDVIVSSTLQSRVLHVTNLSVSSQYQSFTVQFIPQSPSTYIYLSIIPNTDVTQGVRYRNLSVVASTSPTEPTALCQIEVPAQSTGIFKLDQFTGQVVFDAGSNCLPPFTAGCIGGQVSMPVLHNVVAATATTFSDNWNFGFTGYQPHSANDYENGQRGKWRPKATYAFNSAIDYQGNDKNYSAGKFTLSHFNWQHPESSTKSGWLLANRVEKYSPSGDPVEEVNALEIASAAKFGYGGSVPYLVVQNAAYSGVMFESFENVYAGNYLEDNVELVGGFRAMFAHSGKHSFQLTNQFMSRAISSGGKNIQVRFWASGDILPGHITVTAGTGSSATPITQIAQSGGWSLWESMVTPGSDNVFIFITKSGGGTIYMDDLRIQPVDAEMTCYVYDPRTLRLLTVFDDQHFGLYYQYNDEGKLVRKQLETERGIKTIQETQYNLPTQEKNASGN